MNLSRSAGFKLFRNLLTASIRCEPSSIHLQSRSYARKSTLDPDDAPIRFSTSGAVHGIADIRRIDVDDTPWYQSIAVVGSVAVFLIYFCVLREENDIDIELDKNLYDRVEGLEVTNLNVARKYFLEQGNSLEVNKIDVRLKELAAKK
uniref:Uncharacterized protein n=1 Tax=Cacopsylla melanoneura TaxID=428564 RepID=A0A8D8Y3I3_9HEMI